ncbi:hypothetical protein [Thermus amyloliquefaciens]|uniref:hypothetical protein n=1 Tax=Thermus amyloliquefaciens TaxID=1449080 RepID=UPI00248137B6|nr:hypothetical protein [Thermus amyloliquefaciens]
MREILRFLGALLLGLLLVGGTVGLGLFLLVQGEEDLGRELLRLAREKLPTLLFVGFLFTLVLAALLYPVFLGYLAATRALGQEAEIVLANPGHRLRLRGPFELRALAELINRLAQEKEALEKEVAARIAEAKSLLEEERRKLSALIGHLPHGVVLANPKGQVLLYNPKARELLGEGLGVGKSLFGLLDRGLMVHALGLPEERFLTQGPRGPLRLQVVPLEGEGGFLVLLEEAREREGWDAALLHRLRDKLAGLQALAEALGQEARGTPLEPLLKTARATAGELGQLVASWEAPAQAAEVLAEDLFALLAQALERETGVSPGFFLEEEARGLLVQADTYALARGLAAAIGDEEEAFLEGRREGRLLHLTLTLPKPPTSPAPTPTSPPSSRRRRSGPVAAPGARASASTSSSPPGRRPGSPPRPALPPGPRSLTSPSSMPPRSWRKPPWRASSTPPLTWKPPAWIRKGTPSSP